MTDNRTTELLSVGDILWNEPCDERIVVIAANERNVWLRKVQKNDELAMHDGHVWAMLGKKCNVKNMCTQSYAQSTFELDGHVEQAIAATPGSGTLTAEQVRELIAPHLHARPTFDFGHHGAVWSADFQAIADELNAALGSGTCEIDHERYCSNCGVYVHEDAVLVRKSLGNGTWTVVNKPVSYCPNCGKAVKR